VSRFILIGFIVTIPLALCACSYRYDFAVVNKSDRSIEVVYRFKGYWPAIAEEFVVKHSPAKLTLADFQKADYHWQAIPKDQYGFDKLTGDFTVNLGPEEVLFLQYAHNYRGNENEFEVDRIKITGAKGSIDLKGGQAQTQFQLESDTKLVLRYR
jgi:hypothetical protein